ncbi:TonB-dependent siderophore receptor [Verticiella sediminum]|uniref:TonB-dependent siderophore receptor n=1 Tax=Verticiella sediminum TaxID=1247510 RepID=A0A556AVW0_9BURK|nr:TonB-dependent siderophore receptor [Verticiella sediminum]TSH97088.1 TonB-dependent siderophore receptor [Verticiella sediminum]
MQSLSFRLAGTSVAVLAALAVWPHAAHAQSSNAPVSTLATVEVLGTAEEELKQAPGVSIITEQDLRERPPANDIAELIRTMPGVNLTGNSASGQYGNNRQIDLRGMGPENTLVLIDGVPVTSRNSIRMGRSGERNTRGDTNWVPVEAIERVEVLRGPAAARYGSGAAGGVVNIITKRPTDKLSGSVTVYGLVPQHSEEGSTRRASFNLAGPVSDKFSFRLYGNVAKTDADDLSLNEEYATGVTPPAGREGVKNRDINALFRWDLTDQQVLELDTGFSRQGNIYAGDRAVSTTGTETATELANEGAETNTMYRRTATLTHRGNWGAGRTSRVSLSYEGTDNSRYNEGLAGGPEGSISDNLQKSTSKLQNYIASGEYNTPIRLGGLNQVLTVGAEYRQEKLDDPYSMSQSAGVDLPGVDGGTRSGKSSAKSAAVFIEDNIEVVPGLIMTPGLRFDHHDQFGSNWSPSLNASYELTPTITLKGGLARAFKAPNLYQSNPNYLYYTRGNGCPVNYPNQGEGCYILGNADLQPETSFNKEIGIAYNDRGWGAGLTYFHNNYKNKITADMSDQGGPVVIPTGPDTAAQAFRWVNADRAVVQGLEGNLDIPLLGDEGSRLRWTNSFTYMIENKDKSTNQPLSIIPRYTVNSMLDWRINEQFSAQATATFYGKQKPRDRTQSGGDATGDALNERGSYAVFGISAGYQVNRSLYLRAGIDNLFDKRLFRENNSSGAGAATYNEPGRAYYLTATASF